MFTKWKTLFMTSLIVIGLSFTTSCGKGGTNIEIPGVKGPTVSLMQDSLFISMVFENVELDGGLRYNIPKYKYSFLEISPDLNSNGTVMNISISLADLLEGGLDQLDPLKLPGGRNLPGINGGSLPAVAFSIEKFNNMSFYLGKKLFGIFVPTNVGVDGAIASFRYYVANKAAGTISIVGKDENGEHSGLLLMLNISGAVENQLKAVHKKYQ